jgi:serine/threonine-protein kinase
VEARTLAKRYRLEEAIGHGGMGVVHRARDLELDRPVAVKLLASGGGSDADAGLRERFVVEAKRTASLRHPSIVEVFDVGRDGEDAFLVMELLEGETLSQRLGTEKRVPIETAVAIGAQICDALGAAHDGGFVHRDLKPANVFLVAGGEGAPRAKLLDFGIAKRIDGATARTDPATLVGTIEYMAPEQIKGGAIDGRADLYALGLTLYRALTGAHAFVADNVASMIHSHLDARPTPMRDRAPDAKIPAALDGVVLRLLEKEPRRRFSDAREAKRALVESLTAKETTSVTARAESMRMVELEDVPDGVPSLELASKRPLATSVGPVAPMVALEPLPAQAAPPPPAAITTVPGVPSWLAPLARIPEDVSKRVAAYSVIALGIDVVFFGGRLGIVLPLLFLAGGGGLAFWAAKRSRA